MASALTCGGRAAVLKYREFPDTFPSASRMWPNRTRTAYPKYVVSAANQVMRSSLLWLTGAAAAGASFLPAGFAGPAARAISRPAHRAVYKGRI